MSSINLFLIKKKAYGRLNYYPDCENSKLILSWMKNRVAFSNAEICEMMKQDWELTIKEEE